jgi:nucleotide-binding universal stress UspA family protein
MVNHPRAWNAPSVGTIVVGVDGSDRSRQALRWAVAEAKLRKDKVLAVHAWEPPILPAVDIPPAPDPPVYLPELIAHVQEGAEALVERVTAEFRNEGVEVEPLAIEGAPAPVLVEVAEDADLLVVGSRGRGGLTGLLLGSISQQVAQHAPCPVVIHRRREDGSSNVSSPRAR